MGKKIPMWQVLLVMAFTIGALCYSIFFTDYGELHIPLIASATFASIVSIANGYKWAFLEQGIIASINRSMQAMLILMTVGLLIGSWIAGGVVPAMIYYGLMILNPSIFLFAGCIICCIVSLATGSSWTTAGTIGIALIGVGQGLGIDPAMTAGAIVSGAYFGDKMSPLSDTTNLAPAIAGSTLFDHIRHMIWTVTPSLIIALIIYAILGLGQGGGSADLGAVEIIQNGMIDNFTISPLLLLPPVVVIVIVALRMLATLANAMLKFAKSTGSLVAVTIFSCIFMNIIAADQYLAIILPGRMYKQAFEDRRLAPRNLSRCLEDAGTMTSSLVPWNTCGATMATFLGVPTLQYFKYAYLNLINPLVSMFYGFTGISMLKMTDEEYAEVLENREADRLAGLKALES